MGAQLKDVALKSEESRHEKWSGEQKSENEMSVLRVGKSSVIPSEA